MLITMRQMVLCMYFNPEMFGRLFYFTVRVDCFVVSFFLSKINVLIHLFGLNKRCVWWPLITVCPVCSECSLRHYRHRQSMQDMNSKLGAIKVYAYNQHLTCTIHIGLKCQINGPLNNQRSLEHIERLNIQ